MRHKDLERSFAYAGEILFALGATLKSSHPGQQNEFAPPLGDRDLTSTAPPWFFPTRIHQPTQKLPRDES